MSKSPKPPAPEEVDLNATVTLSGEALAALLEEVRNARTAEPASAPDPAAAADPDEALAPVPGVAPIPNDQPTAESSGGSAGEAEPRAERDEKHRRRP